MNSIQEGKTVTLSNHYNNTQKEQETQAIVRLTNPDIPPERPHTLMALRDMARTSPEKTAVLATVVWAQPAAITRFEYQNYTDYYINQKQLSPSTSANDSGADVKVNFR